jgi:3-deoxy-D-arabino-heptulosonate 7-phosphate (DAHP) synthase
VHDNPSQALSDAATQLPLAGFAAFLNSVLAPNPTRGSQP